MSKNNNPYWSLWMDTGGTFTDCLAHPSDGGVRRLKILSSSALRGRITGITNENAFRVEMVWPCALDIFKGFTFRIIGTSASAPIDRVDLKQNLVYLQRPLKKKFLKRSFEITSHEEVPVLAARLLTATGLGKKFPPLNLRLGSTRGTNAILERKGARTALLITKGFKDLLLIGNQQRPDLFALHVIKVLPLYHCVIEVEERIESNGSILVPMNKKNIQAICNELKKSEVTSLAIALLNSYKNPSHEVHLQEFFKSEGFQHISVSHLLSAQIRILPRAETTVANAYLDPIIHSYLAGIKKVLSGAKVSVMSSVGSLVKSESFFPKDSLLSGPAGGVVGAVHQAIHSGIKKIIAFDMGGTSTDVSLYNDRYDYRFESQVGNFKILSPSLAIETIAAGGGSICDFDGYRLTVGPHSAGASPGPACYGAGGPLTITDVNLLLGRLDPENFAIPIAPEISQRALDRLLDKIKKQTGRKAAAEIILESFVQIANEKMAEAIKKISIQQGHDPHNFTLLSFGGAGGQHACALASMLSITKILTPYDAGLLSAFGIGKASVQIFEEQLILERYTEFATHLEPTLQKLYQKAKKRLINEGHAEEDIRLNKTLLFIRFSGQDTALEIDYHNGDDIVNSFREKYISIFGHWIDRAIEIESLKVIASVDSPSEKIPTTAARPYKPRTDKKQEITSGGEKCMGSVYRWEKLKPGAEIKGPALIISDNSTTFIEKHWTGFLDEVNNFHLTKLKKYQQQLSHSPEALLELFTNRFTALAQEMGALLQRTSFSVNVKERLDFSCALLDSDGYLVVNAPHIPVHLGSMGVCVREVQNVIAMDEGDVIITNHPAYGGSHLPDVTVIKPVFYRKKLIGYIANRAHHAEIGGKKPGSMPADATTLQEEGVIIPPMFLVKSGIPQWDSVRKVLTSPPLPSRAPDENLADLNAALAAANHGEYGLHELCSRYGELEVRNHMKALRKYAADLLKEKIKASVKNSFYARERLDDGSVLQVKINRRADRLTIDFTGSSKMHPGNLNATKAIVQSVVLYVLRIWVDQPLPMNEGLLEPINIILPPGLLNPDFSKGNMPAVVGGNTEVSQRLTDTLLKAFSLAACSQGTMNNFLFGNDRFGYYETICGGTGAIAGFHGTDAVHQHMTNTRITDPEILENRYPVRLERFEIRKSSGGQGRWKGGNGVERELFFTESLEVNLLTQHRKEKPYGMKNGGTGKTGEQFLLRSTGIIQKLKGMDSIAVSSGDRLIIKTPGGGAWGKK